MKTMLEIIGAIVGLVVLIIGGYMYIEKRYALKTRLNNIELRLEMEIVNDKMHQTQDRIWVLEDRIEVDPNDKSAKDELRQRKEEKKEYENEINTLRQSIKTVGT